MVEMLIYEHTHPNFGNEHLISMNLYQHAKKSGFFFMLF